MHRMKFTEWQRRSTEFSFKLNFHMFFFQSNLQTPPQEEHNNESIAKNKTKKNERRTKLGL